MIKPVITLAVLLASQMAVLGASAHSQTRSLVEKWVQAKKLVAELKADWKEEREILNQSIAALERELATVKTAIQGADADQSQADKEFEEVSQEKSNLTQFGDRLKALLADLERSVIALNSRLPVGLQQAVATMISRIPEDPNQTKVSLSARMVNVVGFINEVNKYNGSISVVSELRRNESGSELQVKVIYVGLAQAYFSSPDGSFAGMGIPGDNGWEWSEQPSLAPAIQQAIAIYEGSAPAAFVDLPMTIR
ncbi:MAG: DUF3450 family protein [Limisphaerales bacterium]